MRFCLYKFIANPKTVVLWTDCELHINYNNGTCYAVSFLCFDPLTVTIMILIVMLFQSKYTFFLKISLQNPDGEK